MKRIFALIATGASLLAQNQPAPSPVPAAAASAPAPSPVPSGEQVISGSIDLGYRWVTDMHGSFNTYRSVVDLGEGPKLLGTDFTILDPHKHLFDRVDVRAYNWGDDPYSTLHVTARKGRLYDFSGDYRNIAYYSNLPAFADPALGSGLILNEQALDTRKRIGSYRLELLPGRKIVPYLEYEHNADKGTGVSTFVANADEYPVASLVRSSAENYRGGVRLEFSRFHGKVEQGGTTFKDDQQLNSPTGVTNWGNFLSPILGQTLRLTSLSEAYGVRGHGIYTDASFSANPVSWADLYGTFLYSEPQSTVNFRALDTGNQVLFSSLLFYTGEQNLISALSKQPHTSASFGAEIRPFSRLRLMPSWLTDRMHTTGSSVGAQSLTTASGNAPISSLLSSALVTNWNQAEMNILFDLAKNFTVRGGYRYVWGDASDVILPLAGLAGLEQGKIRRHVFLAGGAWHPVQNAWINVDFESGISGSAYFRTSLYNYEKARIRGRHRISNSFSAAASFSLLKNENPSPGIHYDFFVHSESASLQYTPDGGKHWDFEGGYTRSTVRSDIGYLDPQYLLAQRSFYRDNSHTLTALFDLKMPGWLGYKTTLALGGSALLASGSNPTTFYQPTARLAIALNKNVSWMSEWRYYGFDESYFLYQSFRTHTITTGVRITR